MWGRRSRAAFRPACPAPRIGRPWHCTSHGGRPRHCTSHTERPGRSRRSGRSGPSRRSRHARCSRRSRRPVSAHRLVHPVCHHGSFAQSPARTTHILPCPPRKGKPAPESGTGFRFWSPECTKTAIVRLHANRELGKRRDGAGQRPNPRTKIEIQCHFRKTDVPTGSTPSRIAAPSPSAAAVPPLPLGRQVRVPCSFIIFKRFTNLNKSLQSR